MKNITISDITLRECDRGYSAKLSFKEKQEIAKLLEKLNIDVIETGYVGEKPADATFIRMLAGALEQSILCIPVEATRESIDAAWSVLSKAKKPRLNLIIPTSAIGMEYSLKMKPDAVLPLVKEMTAYAKSICGDVEFTADDAVRSEPDFLAQVIKTAIDAGAGTITLCDSGGELLPGEISTFVSSVLEKTPGLGDVTLAFHIKNSMGLACAIALSGIDSGVNMLKVSSGSESETLPVEGFLSILKVRGDTLGISCNLSTVSYQRICDRIGKMTGTGGVHTRTGRSGDDTGTQADKTAVQMTGITDIEGLRSYIKSIGYDLSEEDLERVFAQYKDIARSKDVVADDIEAIIAETAGQAPPVYKLKSFVINSGSLITATANVEFEKDGEIKTALSAGDGPIDAAFKAAESIVGRRYELEDFQIHAVTSGREATGDALIKIRCDGKLYSGRGVSTDIVGASIRAYLSAVNKILSEV